MVREFGVIRYDINSPKMRGLTMHNDFTVFLRVVPSGKKVVYYYTYDESGKRRGPWSTGLANKTAARNYCIQLIREQRLAQGKGDMPTFAEYARGWWEWETCPYLKDRRKRAVLTQSYADSNKKMLVNQLLPYFGKMRLDRISPDEIDCWFDYMAEKGYKNTYTNTILKSLKTMMNWAVKKKILVHNPIADVEGLTNNQKPIKLLNADEFKALFLNDWQRIWGNDRIAYMANKLAALTGMRCSEVLGLRGEYVFDSYIYLCAQYDEYGYRDTKTKDKHNIPLASCLIDELRELIALNGKGFLFSVDGGATPVCRRVVYNGLLSALHKMGMSKAEIKERGLCVHAWRHFCNTELQKAGMSVKKVQAIIGHKTENMTEHYTHFDPTEFGEVPRVQEALLRRGSEPPETGNDRDYPAGLRLIKNTPQEAVLKRA
jgi:integrase